MEGPEFIPTLSISTKDVKSLPELNLDDEGMLSLKFKVTGANKYKDENGEEYYSYTMEYEVDDVDVNKVSLQEASRRAGESKDIYVKTQSNPSPG